MALNQHGLISRKATPIWFMETARDVPQRFSGQALKINGSHYDVLETVTLFAKIKIFNKAKDFHLSIHIGAVIRL